MQNCQPASASVQLVDQAVCGSLKLTVPNYSEDASVTLGLPNGSWQQRDAGSVGSAAGRTPLGLPAAPGRRTRSMALVRTQAGIRAAGTMTESSYPGDRALLLASIAAGIRRHAVGGVFLDRLRRRPA